MSEKSGFGNKYSFGPDLDFVLGSHQVEVFTSEDIPCVFPGDGVTVLDSAEQSAASCQLALQLPAHSRLNHTM